jgi:hypothetical protein
MVSLMAQTDEPSRRLKLIEELNLDRARTHLSFAINRASRPGHVGKRQLLEDLPRAQKALGLLASSLRRDRVL